MKPKTKSPFLMGKDYNRSQIHAELGGNTQSYLPFVGGKVVCACLTTKLNPGAPRIILVGRGRDIERAGQLLSRQAVPIPVFIKQTKNRWTYRGLWRVRDSSQSPESIEKESSPAQRADVTSVIYMTRPKTGQQTARRVWIFQAVPARYDLLKEVPKSVF